MHYIALDGGVLQCSLTFYSGRRCNFPSIAVYHPLPARPRALLVLFIKASVVSRSDVNYYIFNYPI